MNPSAMAFLVQSGGKAVQAGGALYTARKEAEALAAQAAETLRTAAEAEAAGKWQQQRRHEDTRRLLSSQRAAFGAAGVTMEGAPTQLQARTQREAVLDRMMLARNTEQLMRSLHRDAAALLEAAETRRTTGLIEAFGSFF